MPLDIGVGILLSLLISHTFEIPLTPLLIALSIVAALLPDIDIVSMVWGRWRHREYTHYPAIYIPIVALAFLIFGTGYAALLAIGVFIHLLHDTIGIGWGVSWLWPFTKRRFLLFPEKGRRARYGLFMTWLPEKQNTIISELSSQHWLVRYYLRPSFLGLIEYSFLLISIVIFALYRVSI